MAVKQKMTWFEVCTGYVATETNLVKMSAFQGLTSICADRAFNQFQSEPAMLLLLYTPILNIATQREKGVLKLIHFILSSM